MLTVRELMANVEVQGEVIVREYSHEKEEYTAEEPIHSEAATRLMDKEAKYIYPLPDGKSLAIEVFAEE
ncbi:MAG: hypothetical protein IJI27_05405 [Oscillospiraceae bacterium]|nr:hypothetical protein [Oscillospiraceae bacterium]